MESESFETHVMDCSTALAIEAPIDDRWALPVIHSLVTECKESINEPGIYFFRMSVSKLTKEEQ